jgi:hypothetical protein
MGVAVVVPDEAALTMWGHDPRGAGLEPAAAPEDAALLVGPKRIPPALAAAVAEAWSRMPPPRLRVVREVDLPGMSLDEILGDGAPGGGASLPGAHHDGDGHDDQQGHHGDHDHHDMMAIVGDPSEDGLVMEAIDFELGPLAPGLPGGLIVELSLDGDVVAGCRPHPVLEMATEEVAGGAPPDPLAPAAWAAAMARALDGSETVAGLRVHIVNVELERALSHAAWLRSLARTLGWGELVDLAQDAVSAISAARAAGVERRSVLSRAIGRADRLAAALGGSRRLRARVGGRGALSRSRLEASGVGGPVARAAGLARDARIGEPAYDALGFQAELHDGCDGEARTILRAAEARSALRLATAALDQLGAEESVPLARGGDALVEGPRGPLLARPGVQEDIPMAVAAPGSSELAALAGEAVVGLELGAAMAALVSFDLSPWQVNG